MLKEAYISGTEFLAQVLSIEIGLIPEITKDYFMRVFPSKYGRNFDDCLFLPYPFKQSFTAATLDFSSDSDRVNECVKNYYKENRDKIGFNTELPIYCLNNTFENFYESRLENFISSSIRKDNKFYLKHKNDKCIMNSERNAIFIYTNDTLLFCDGNERIFIKTPDGNTHHLGEVGTIDSDLYYDSTTDFYTPESAIKIVMDGIQKHKSDPVICPFKWIDY